MARIQILLHKPWGVEGFHRCLAEGLNQSSVSSVTQATQPLILPRDSGKARLT